MRPILVNFVIPGRWQIRFRQDFVEVQDKQCSVAEPDQQEGTAAIGMRAAVNRRPKLQASPGHSTRCATTVRSARLARELRQLHATLDPRDRR